MPNIETLVDDIYHLFNDEHHHEPNEENLKQLGQNVMDIVRLRLAKRDEGREALRFSSMGKKDRQLWYQHNLPNEGERLNAKTLFKFLYGDMIEQLLLFFAKEAGHTVEREQEELEVDGVKGHIDAVIDGVVVDVKSASPYSYKKFADGTLLENDPFGYIAQLSGYSETLTPGKGAAFLVADKVHGDIGLMKVSGETTQQFKPAERIAHLKEVLVSPDVPPRCYEAVPDGKSGNEKLGVNCSYCAFKNICWQDSNNGHGLRKFIYYNGPTWLTKVVNEPRVMEVKAYEERSAD